MPDRHDRVEHGPVGDIRAVDYPSNSHRFFVDFSLQSNRSYVSISFFVKNLHRTCLGEVRNAVGCFDKRTNVQTWPPPRRVGGDDGEWMCRACTHIEPISALLRKPTKTV
jgi:hypothetical protein